MGVWPILGLIHPVDDPIDPEKRIDHVWFPIAPPVLHPVYVPVPGLDGTVPVPASQKAHAPEDHKKRIEGQKGVIIHGEAKEMPQIFF